MFTCLFVLAVSYSSSDDDEDDFFDAHDDVASKAGSDICPPAQQEDKDLVSPLTPSDVDWDSLYEEAVEEEEVDMKSHGSVITHLLSQESKLNARSCVIINPSTGILNLLLL